MYIRLVLCFDVGYFIAYLMFNSSCVDRYLTHSSTISLWVLVLVAFAVIGWEWIGFSGCEFDLFLDFCF